MFLSKRLLGRIPSVTLINEISTGTYSVYMVPGVYDITACAPGGGGVCAYATLTGTSLGYARGGVGGTVRVRVRVNTACTATIYIPPTVGGAGYYHGSPQVFNQQFVNAGVGWTAPTGGNTTITGIPNLSLTCYGGTGASFYADTNSTGTGTPGTQGSVSVSGSAIISTSINSNLTPVTSLQSSGRQDNTNEPMKIGEVMPSSGVANYRPGFGGNTGTPRATGGTGGYGHVRIIRVS